MMEYYIARQPIFDKKQVVIGYELLFRNGIENHYNFRDDDEATSKVLTTGYFLIGFDELTNGKKAIINFTNQLLEEQIYSLFPNNLVSVALNGEIDLNLGVINACQDLNQKGYTLIVENSYKNTPIWEYANIVEVDFQKITPDERKKTAESSFGSDKIYLAKKVETIEEFQQAVDFGYEYFQGFFFCKPELHSKKEISPYKISYMDLLNEVNKSQLNYDKIEKIIKHDVSLTYRLFRYINSAFFGFQYRIKSIRHALNLLGQFQIKKWVSLVTLSNMAENKPQELINNCVVRARFCEQLSIKMGMQNISDEFFILGMFSQIDAILDRKMETVLDDLPILNDIKIALAGGNNKYREVLEVILDYEKGNWLNLEKYKDVFKMNKNDLPNLYYNSIKMANQFLKNNYIMMYS